METALPPGTAYAYAPRAGQSGPHDPGRHTLGYVQCRPLLALRYRQLDVAISTALGRLRAGIFQRIEGTVCDDRNCLGVCGGPVVRVAVAWPGGRRLDTSSKVPGRGVA